MLLGVYPKELKTCYLHRNLHTDVSSSFIYNCPKLEATKMSFNREMDKQAVVYPYDTYETMVFINPMEGAINLCKDTEEP